MSNTTPPLLNIWPVIIHWHCAIHGTVTKCPFKWMDCTLSDDNYVSGEIRKDNYGKNSYGEEIGFRNDIG